MQSPGRAQEFADVSNLIQGVRGPWGFWWSLGSSGQRHNELGGGLLQRSHQSRLGTGLFGWCRECSKSFMPHWGKNRTAFNKLLVMQAPSGVQQRFFSVIRCRVVHSNKGTKASSRISFASLSHALTWSKTRRKHKVEGETAVTTSTDLAAAKIPSEVPAFEHPTLGDSIRQALLLKLLKVETRGDQSKSQNAHKELL